MRVDCLRLFRGGRQHRDDTRMTHNHLHAFRFSL